jgi:Wall-associated receptor kinase galacturonan-binding
MLDLILFLSLIATSTASCNRSCGETTVPYPFGFSPSCHMQLSCNSTSGISFSGFPVQNFTANNTFTLKISEDCNRQLTSASQLFSTNYSLTYRNGLFLLNCPTSVSSSCQLPTILVSQLTHQLSSCGSKDDNLTCLYNNTAGLKKDSVLRTHSSCQNLLTSILYGQNEEGQIVLALGIVEIEWWMTGNCRCAANASCQRVDASEAKNGYWCKCNEGFVGDGFADGDGCRGKPY